MLKNLIRPNEELEKRKKKAKEFDDHMRAWLSQMTVELSKMDMVHDKIETIINKEIPSNASREDLITYIGKIKKELSTIIRRIE